MHAILVIFKKDVRHLWWQIGVMLALLAAVGCLDARRAEVTPGIVEGLLNLVIPLVWACLIAQAVQGEALVGDREFWMTRPYRWPRLLAAKALFAVLVVHAPSFATDAAILVAHGFNPIEALPHLLEKQLLLAAGLTFPAMALAVVVSNLTQFVVGIPVLLATLTLSSSFQPHFAFDRIRFSAALALLAPAAVSIVLLQYGRRRTGWARILAGATVLAAGLLIALISFSQAFALEVAIHPAANVPRAMTLAAPDSRQVHGPFSRRVFTELPFTVSGLPAADWCWLNPLFMEIAASNGVRYEYRPPQADFDVATSAVEHGKVMFMLGLRHAAYDRIKDSRVTISGTAALRIYQRGQAIQLSLGATRDVPGAGRCSYMFVEGLYEAGWLTVSCESPSRDLMTAGINIHEESMLGLRPAVRTHGSNASPTPLVAWLSPLQRLVQTNEIRVPDNRTSSEMLAGTTVVIVPQRPTGYATVAFKAADIDLREYSK
jgi:hypothetical protein